MWICCSAQGICVSMHCVWNFRSVWQWVLRLQSSVMWHQVILWLNQYFAKTSWCHLILEIVVSIFRVQTHYIQGNYNLYIYLHCYMERAAEVTLTTCNWCVVIVFCFSTGSTCPKTWPAGNHQSHADSPRRWRRFIWIQVSEVCCNIFPRKHYTSVFQKTTETPIAATSHTGRSVGNCFQTLYPAQFIFFEL